MALLWLSFLIYFVLLLIAVGCCWFLLLVGVVVFPLTFAFMFFCYQYCILLHIFLLRLLLVEVVIVIEENDDGWVLCESEGRVGFFPTDYLQIIRENSSNNDRKRNNNSNSNNVNKSERGVASRDHNDHEKENTNSNNNSNNNLKSDNPMGLLSQVFCCSILFVVMLFHFLSS